MSFHDDWVAQLTSKRVNERIIDGEHVSEQSDKTLPQLVDEQCEQAISVPQASSTGDNELDDDFEAARQNLRQMAYDGSLTLGTLHELAQQSQHPRMFEVLANLIKTLSSVNIELLDLHERKEKVASKKGQESGETPSVNQTYNDNRVFTGSTAEMAEYAKQRRQQRGDNNERRSDESGSTDDSTR